MKSQELTRSILIFAALFNTHCGTDELIRREIDNQHSTEDSVQKDPDTELNEWLSQASLGLEVTQTSANSSDAFAHISYVYADFALAIRCNSAWTLRRANGMPARTEDGRLVSMTALEARAVWESAVASTDHCTSFGEKLIRASLADPIAASGTYFYLLRPCRVPISGTDSGMPRFGCSSHLLSTPNINLRNEQSDHVRQIFKEILLKENQLIGVALKLRSHLSFALEAQVKCEQNTTVDAVREAKAKALRTVLSTSVAAAVGGAIAGPAGALTAAKQTLSWITDYLGSGTKANPAQCTQMKDAETQTELAAIEIESLHKKISQLKAELADLDAR